MIRRATLDDIPALLEIGARFSNRANLAGHVGYDAASLEATLRFMIDGDHPVFVGDAGTIGATVFPHPFNHAHKAAQELFWWSEGREGLALLNALTEHCRANCDSLTMITLEAVDPVRTGELYERKGFRPLEHSYIKVF